MNMLLKYIYIILVNCIMIKLSLIWNVVNVPNSYTMPG